MGKKKGTYKARKAKLKIANLRQRKVLSRIMANIGKGERTSMTQAAIAEGYSANYAKSGVLQKTDTWNDLVEKYLPDDALAQAHIEGLKAKLVKTATDEGQITDEKFYPDHQTRFKFLDSAYKLKKRYDNTINVRGEIGRLGDDEIEDRISGIISGIVTAIAGEIAKGE